MSLETNPHLQLSTRSAPSLLWLVSPWHSWEDMNYDRVDSTTISNGPLADEVLDAIDGWFPLYAAHIASNHEDCTTDGTDIALCRKFELDDPQSITNYDMLRAELEEGRYVKSLPPDLPEATRVFEMKDAFQSKRDTVSQLTVYRTEPDQDAIKLIDSNILGPTDQWGYNLAIDTLQNEIEQVYENHLGWHSKYQYEDGLKYFCWAFYANPGNVWLGQRLDEPTEPSLGERLTSSLNVTRNTG